MNFIEPLPEWNDPGIEPPQQLKDDGWRYTQRPPASYFNWVFFTTYYALKEIQDNALHQSKLYDNTDSADPLLIATANAVKKAYDKAVASETNSKSYTDSKVAGLVDSAPTTLDTLNELAQALADDPNFATTITNLIGTKISSTEKGAANGVATLGSDSKIPIVQQTDASLTQKGIVQLSSVTDSTSESLAATPNGVKKAYDRAVSAENTAKGYADSKVAALVDSSPTTLDTLNELATALGDDPNFATTITNLIGAKISSTEKGAINGIATLGVDGKVPIGQQQDGSLTQKGILQLSSITDSEDETFAATPKAVKAAMDQANAAFLSANNGKTSLAGVIGAPTTAGDTFTKMTSDIQSIKDTMITYLTNKSQSLIGAESLKELVDDIIALNP